MGSFASPSDLGLPDTPERDDAPLGACLDGRLAVWHDETDALIAGGVYPAELFEFVLEEAAGEESVDPADLVDAETADTLSREPESFADEVTALMLSVQ